MFNEWTIGAVPNVKIMMLRYKLMCIGGTVALHLGPLLLDTEQNAHTGTKIVTR